MNYSSSLRYLNSFLNLEQIYRPPAWPAGRHSRIWNLKRMRELLQIFGHPERGILTVLIGGTKGKGSTGYFLSEILRQSGLRVGFYQSPHLETPRERIWIGGRPVSESDFAQGLSGIRKTLSQRVIARSVATKQSLRLLRPFRRKGRLKESLLVLTPAASGLRPATKHGGARNDGVAPFTYFEIMTLLAILLFKERGVEAAVYEVGMGGRLDATHALPAKLVILTPIHYDHEAYLGETLPEIAREKAAILVPDRDAVVAPELPQVAREIERVARKRGCRLWPPLDQRGMKIKLLGDFQRLNAQVALRAASLLKEKHHLPITEGAMARGIGSNHWPGRMELFKGRPSILLDGAHNPKSIEALSRNLKRLFPKQRKILVFGTSRDKRSERMIPPLAKVFQTCILTQSDTPRAKELPTLLAEASGQFPVVIPTPSSKEALRLARRLAHPNDLIVVTGSFYLIGELRSLCRK